MKYTAVLRLCAAGSILCLSPVFAAGEPALSNAAPADALARLKQGNQRFVSGKLVNPNQTAERRLEQIAGQYPFAIVLGCADSRVPPEVVFDQGLGDLFVVRVAGNVLNDEAIASIEYAVDHFNTRLVVVLGHERCGAVDAARKTIAAKAKAPGHIQSLVDAIRPAVDATAGEDLEATVSTNVLDVAESLRHSAPILNASVAKGMLTVVGARYDMDTGVVTFFPDRKSQQTSK